MVVKLNIKRAWPTLRTLKGHSNRTTSPTLSYEEVKIWSISVDVQCMLNCCLSKASGDYTLILKQFHKSKALWSDCSSDDITVRHVRITAAQSGEDVITNEVIKVGPLYYSTSYRVAPDEIKPGFRWVSTDQTAGVTLINDRRVHSEFVKQ